VYIKKPRTIRPKLSIAKGKVAFNSYYTVIIISLMLKTRNLLEALKLTTKLSSSVNSLSISIANYINNAFPSINE